MDESSLFLNLENYFKIRMGSKQNFNFVSNIKV